MRQTFIKKVDLKRYLKAFLLSFICREIEDNVKTRLSELKSNILYRVVCFSSSRKYLVDLSSDMIEGSRFALRFKPEFLANLACHYTYQSRRVDTKEEKPKKEEF